MLTFAHFLTATESFMSSSSRLSRIETQWSMVHRAHKHESDSRASVQSQLIERYGPAIRRYLLASMRNSDAAAEVYQEFALRLVRGDFRNADSDKGRFRNMIKTALYRLMIDYYRRTDKQKKLGVGMVVEDVAVAADAEPARESFTLAWRESLIDESWKRLEQLEAHSGNPYYTVLRARVDQPQLTTRQLRESLLNTKINLPNESAFRVLLHRCRKRFAAILLDQVVQSLDNPTDEEIELELIDLGLHHYCKPVSS
jgi:RNA polymerase sigma-70 factor (ECF subfamily)